MKKLTCILLLNFSWVSWVGAECPKSFDDLNPADYRSENLKAPAKNIIILIGDGMGPEQVRAGFPQSDPFGDFPFRTLATHCSLSGVTDSAASATAMATGFKTLNGYLAKDAQGKPLQTLLEIAQSKNKSVGLVTTTEVTHATPAAFAAHQADRDDAVPIAIEYLEKTRPDVLLGGGEKFFRSLGLKENGNSNPVLFRGYWVVSTQRSLKRALALKPDSNHLLGLFAESHLPWVDERGRQVPSLAEMSQAALDFLKRDADGFFLMIEGGRIDHASHMNAFDPLRGEMREFGKTAQMILKWARQNPGTLVLLTADHETGGLKITGKEHSWSTHLHTETPVFLVGSGPNADVLAKFSTVDNCAVFHIANQAWQ